MKKIYFLAVSLLLGAGAIAQTTVTNHFEGAVADPMPANWQIGTYQWQQGNGYVSGSNVYEDKAILQLFDGSYGVSGAGTVDNLKINIAYKSMDPTNSTSVTVGIWENNNGSPGALIGSEDIQIADIDTALASTQFIMDGQTVKGLYNVDVTFATPVTIPANLSYFAGITLPNTTEIANGDTIVVLTTLDGGNYQFVDANTHAGGLDQTDSWAPYGSFNIEIANAIFPTMSFTGDVDENNLDLSVYPNPAENVLNIDAAESLSSVKVIGMDGRVVVEEEINGNTVSIDVSSIESGSYYYEVVSSNGAVSRSSFVKK